MNAFRLTVDVLHLSGGDHDSLEQVAGLSVDGKHLPRALAHLAALAAEAAHALLAPLGTHTTVDVHQHGKRVCLLDAGLEESRGVDELRAAVHQALHVGGDELGILDAGLDLSDRGLRRHIKRDGARKRLHKDLHLHLRILDAHSRGRLDEQSAESV